jgi:hypothetical protein
MNRSELESKHLSELHDLAAEAGVPSYRMLSRTELIARLSDGNGEGGGSGPVRSGQRRRRPRDERPRERRDRGERRPRRERDGQPKPEPQVAPATTPPPGRGRRKRRRRFRRRRKELRLHELLLPPTPGRQALVYSDSRTGCTALLREIAASLSGASKGPDPVAVLVDPSPEELADWRRDAPRAEIVAAGQARHVEDAVAQAASRAAGGQDVIVLIDSLSRLVEAYGDAEAAEEVFETASPQGGGTLTVVAALERSA